MTATSLELQYAVQYVSPTVAGSSHIRLHPVPIFFMKQSRGKITPEVTLTAFTRVWSSDTFFLASFLEPALTKYYFRDERALFAKHLLKKQSISIQPSEVA